MITRNFYNHMAAQISGANITDGWTDYGGTKRVSAYTTNSSYSHSYWRSPYYIMSTESVKTAIPSLGGGVVFGDGDTAPTLDDYQPAGSVISGITATGNVSSSTDDDGAFCTGVFDITNNNSEAVTIREVCLYAYLFYAPSKRASGLIDRTVLDSPVTIPAGGVGQVTYTIRMNYPT